MSKLEIRNLLDKYWDGESSLEEETILRDYFSSGDVADEFESYQPLFSFFTEARSVAMKSDITNLPAERIKSTAKLRDMGWWRSAAAAVLLALGLFFVNRQLSTPAINTLVYQDTYEDPEIAYQEFKKVMQFVSGKMNKGVNTAAKGINKIETLTNILN